MEHGFIFILSARERNKSFSLKLLEHVLTFFSLIYDNCLQLVFIGCHSIPRMLGLPAASHCAIKIYCFLIQKNVKHCFFRKKQNKGKMFSFHKILSVVFNSSPYFLRISHCSLSESQTLRYSKIK